MQLTVKSRNLELTDALRTYAEKKLAKLEKQLHPTTQIELELAVEKNPSIAANQVAEATVWLKGPHTLRVREASPDMKASIDELSRHLLRQIKDERERRRSKSKRAAAAVPLE
jgi:ribosome hibernation promoting factor